MKIRVCLLAICTVALMSSAAHAWGPRRGFYFGVYGPPVYGPPAYGPPVYPAPVYGPPVYPPPVVVAPPPRAFVAPGPAFVAPGPPGYYYPRPAVGATLWFR
jgi:hypothetical protein